MDRDPLVLHVIPTPAARGAQREARALADNLDTPGVRRHRVLTLFERPSEVSTDFSLGFRGGTEAARGFDPRLVIPLRASFHRLEPAVVISHGSDPMKYLVTAMIGRRHPLVFYAIGTYAGRTDRRAQLLLWRTLARRADRVTACGEEVRDECTSLLRVPAANVFLTANGRDPRSSIPPTQAPSPPSPQLCTWVPSPPVNVRTALSIWLPIFDPEESSCEPGSSERARCMMRGGTGKAFRR